MSTQKNLLQPSRVDSPEVLYNEQIEHILREAEIRLKAKAKATSQLQDAPEEWDTIELVATTKRKPSPKLTNSLNGATYIKEMDGIARADETQLLSKQRTLSNVLREAEAYQISKPKQKKDEKPSSGPEWFDLPRTVLTPQLKRDLQIIELRSVLDPHRHYKKTSGKDKVPAFSQVGTVVEGPTEWYSSRINKKDRANNFVEEIMANEKESVRFKRKYGEIQAKKTSGKKAHYKSLMDKRRRRR